MKRFYQAVAVVEAAPGWQVRLDGRPVRTPERAALALPTRTLAEAVAAEWQAQGETVRPHAMPLTQIAATAIDRVAPQRAAVLEALLAYAGTDLLCYRAAGPAGLIARQAALWQPPLDWLALTLDAPLSVTHGILPLDQPPAALAALGAALAALDDMQLGGVQAAAAATGSIVLALALLHGRLSAAEAVAAVHLDEHWQAERWGTDAEAEARRDAVAVDITAAATFLALLTEPSD